MRLSHCLIVLCGVMNSITAAAEPRFELLVAGSGSDNIVRFDLATGEGRVAAKLANGSKPRSLVINAEGRLFVGLRGNAKNIVELAPRRPRRPDSVLIAKEVTPSIGRFGPGMMAFDGNGQLFVAADTERLVQRYDIQSRQMVGTIGTGRGANIVGLAIHEDSLYVAEYFQKSILRIDLRADPPMSEVLVKQSEQLDRPHGMTVGHNGQLFVSNLQNDLVQEFELQTGAFLRTFVDVKSLGASHVNDFHFCRALERYFLSSGNTVYELGTDGSLLSRYENPALIDAQGIACRAVR